MFKLVFNKQQQNRVGDVSRIDSHILCIVDGSSDARVGLASVRFAAATAQAGKVHEQTTTQRLSNQTSRVLCHHWSTSLWSFVSHGGCCRQISAIIVKYAVVFERRRCGQFERIWLFIGHTGQLGHGTNRREQGRRHVSRWNLQFSPSFSEKLKIHKLSISHSLSLSLSIILSPKLMLLHEIQNISTFFSSKTTIFKINSNKFSYIWLFKSIINIFFKLIFSFLPYFFCMCFVFEINQTIKQTTERLLQNKFFFVYFFKLWTFRVKFHIRTWTKNKRIKSNQLKFLK